MLNPSEEAKFAELKEKCRELHVPAPPEIMIGLQVHDKDGELILDDIQRGHSWTRNFWNIMCGILTRATGQGASFAAGNMSVKETGGTLRNSSTYCAGSGSHPSYGIANSIIVGTGDSTFDVNGYVLAAIIGDGSGAGQLNHVGIVQGATAYDEATKTWTTQRSRIFNNNSGDAITVKETGMYGYFMGGGTSYPYNATGPFFLYGSTIGSTFLTERSVLSPTVPVPNGAQLTVTYSMSMDFSAID